MFKESPEGQTHYCHHTTDPKVICDKCLGKPEGVGGWEEKLMDLVEKECDMFDTRPKKTREMHPGNGECYLNDILGLVQNLLLQEKAKWEHKIRTMFTADEVQGMLKGEREVCGLEGYEKGRKEVLEAVLARMESCATARECRHIIKEYLL